MPGGITLYPLSFLGLVLRAAVQSAFLQHVNQSIRLRIKSAVRLLANAILSHLARAAKIEPTQCTGISSFI